MNIAHILYPVEVLGPGKRVGIWFAGCPRRCQGCSNPELWEKREDYEIALEELVSAVTELAKTHPVDGFTFTGGDPMMQFEDCIALAKALSRISKDVLVYTGYTYEELPQPLEGIAAIIDGPYRKEENRFSPLKGSENQRLILLDESLRSAYEQCLHEKGGRVQTFRTKDGYILVGIHHPDFLSDPDDKG